MKKPGYPKAPSMTDQCDANGRSGSLFPGGRVLRYLGSALLTGVSLWWIASHSGPERGTVVIHVTEPDVTVSVDDQVFRVGADHYTPITCELPPGEHQLRMTRGRTLLYAQSFTLRKGEDRVLTVWHAPAGNGQRLDS
jgi:hypothetical protein